MTYRLQCAVPFAKSDFLPDGWFDQTFSRIPIADAIEAMPDDDTPVQIVDVDTGTVVWDSSEVEFEDGSSGRGTW